MTKAEALEYIREHDDDSALDQSDMEDAFTALYDRRPDDEDRAAGLWSLLCAAL